MPTPRYLKPCAIVALILAILTLVPAVAGLPLLVIAVIVLCLGVLVP